MFNTRISLLPDPSLDVAKEGSAAVHIMYFTGDGAVNGMSPSL
jgi:hypothetical protein